jgi:hypothetical protein
MCLLPYFTPAPYGWAALSGKLLWRLAQPVAGSSLHSQVRPGQLKTVIAQFKGQRKQKGAKMGC